jgi:uncharacterized damage-inducible protein DinB
MAIAEALVQELEHEGGTTRRILERVPTDKFIWKPHAKSMSLGELGFHIASTPGLISSWALSDVMDFASAQRPDPAKTTADLLSAHDQSISKAKTVASQLGDAGLMREWEAKMNGNTMFKMPKVALFRNIVLNHWIHHRGQLSVYLRLLDIPVPSIYGPSADENPFAG